MSKLIHKAPVMLGNFILKHKNRILVDSIPTWDTRVNVSFTDACTLDKASLSNTINAYLAEGYPSPSSASLRYIYLVDALSWLGVYFDVYMKSTSERMRRFWFWSGRTAPDSTTYLDFFNDASGPNFSGAIINEANDPDPFSRHGFSGGLGFIHDSRGGTYTNPEDIVALPDSVFGTHSQSVSWSFYIPEIASDIYNAADALSAFGNDFTLGSVSTTRGRIQIGFTYSWSYNGNSGISARNIYLDPTTMQIATSYGSFPVSVPVSVSAVSAARSIYSRGNFVDYIP